MDALAIAWFLALACTAQPLAAGDHVRTIEAGGQQRLYRVHVPAACVGQDGTPVVLVFHGFGADAERMVRFCGMNQKADQAGFVAVYPQGTGTGDFRVFNAGGIVGPLGEALPDDVAMVRVLLEDLGAVVRIDPRRIYATGMSLGAMMCYRLAVDLSDRIAAIAPVAGTMPRDLARPKRPVPVIHFHGTLDRVVPLDGLPPAAADSFRLQAVEETIRYWAEVNGCRPTPCVAWEPNLAEDETLVQEIAYSTAMGDTPVILYRIEGGGHTWPGQTPPPAILGKSTKDISANDLIWDFFQRHPLPPHAEPNEAAP